MYKQANETPRSRQIYSGPKFGVMYNRAIRKGVNLRRNPHLTLTRRSNEQVPSPGLLPRSAPRGAPRGPPHSARSFAQCLCMDANCDVSTLTNSKRRHAVKHLEKSWASRGGGRQWPSTSVPQHLVSSPMQVVKCEGVREEQHLLSAAREEKGDMAALSALMS